MHYFKPQNTSFLILLGPQSVRGLSKCCGIMKIVQRTFRIHYKQAKKTKRYLNWRYFPKDADLGEHGS